MALSVRDIATRWSIARALGQIGDARALPALLEVAHQCDEMGARALLGVAGEYLRVLMAIKHAHHRQVRA